ncbi:MAG: ABC transporter permease [Pseudomonadota bacterium]|nr:ABC transporter permease [Pseudomonadota bacterium]
MSLAPFKRVAAMLQKESLQVLRDPAALAIAFALPPLLLFLFGYAVNLDTARTAIGVAVLDHGDAALSLTAAFQHSRWFDVTTRNSVTELKTDLIAGRVRGIVVVPQDFSRENATGSGDIQVITDGSLPNTASFVAAYAEGVRATWAAQRAEEKGRPQAAAPFAIIPRFWFNPELTSRYFLVPGSMAIVLTIVGTLLTALVIAREWERGTMEALMATPLSMVEFIASKVLPYFLLGLGSALLCVLLGVFVFGVPFRGSALALLLIVSAYLLPALGQGLFISAITKNQFVASQIALLTAFLPALLLSGFLFEISSMPRWIQILTYGLPVQYLIPLLQSVFLAGDLWGLFVHNILVMLGFGMLYFSLTLLVTRRRIA